MGIINLTNRNRRRKKRPSGTLIVACFAAGDGGGAILISLEIWRRYLTGANIHVAHKLGAMGDIFPIFNARRPPGWIWKK